jgi:hypothetical protein
LLFLVSPVLKPHLFVRGLRGLQACSSTVAFWMSSCARLDSRGRLSPRGLWWRMVFAGEGARATWERLGDISDSLMWYSALKSAWRFQIDE